MFKAASGGPAEVITANNLGDGRVVFLDPEGGRTQTQQQADDCGAAEVAKLKAATA